MAEEKQKMQYLVRVANTDLDGSKPLVFALGKVKGVSTNLATMICNITGLDKQKKAGFLDEKEVSVLNETVSDLVKAGIPVWARNRRKDYESGEDKHIISGDLDFTQQNDVKRLAKIKSYRGLRHQWRLPVRGQRTSSNFRKGKSKAANAAKKGRRKTSA